MNHFQKKTVIAGYYEIDYDELSQKLGIPFIKCIINNEDTRKLTIITESVEIEN